MIGHCLEKANKRLASAAMTTTSLAVTPSPTFSCAAFVKYTPAVKTWLCPGYGGAPLSVVRWAIAFAEYGPMAKSSGFPLAPKLTASHSVGARAVRSMALETDFRQTRRFSRPTFRAFAIASGRITIQQTQARNHPS